MYNEDCQFQMSRQPLLENAERRYDDNNHGVYPSNPDQVWVLGADYSSRLSSPFTPSLP